MTLFAPSFVKEEIQHKEDYEREHPQAFKTLHQKDRDVHFTFQGSSKNPKIIFVHGSPGDWGAFVEILRRGNLGRSSYVIVADRLGYGGSARGGVERSLEAQARALMELMNEGDPNQSVILVGHSYGGPVVAKMATLGDKRIRSILILAGAVDPALEETKWYQVAADWSVFRWMVPQDLVTCNQEIMALKNELEIMSNEWNSIKSRVSVIQGMKDDLVPPGNADFIAQKAKHLNPKIIRLENQNHFLQAYENDLIEKTLLEELESIK